MDQMHAAFWILGLCVGTLVYMALGALCLAIAGFDADELERRSSKNMVEVLAIAWPLLFVLLLILWVRGEEIDIPGPKQ